MRSLLCVFVLCAGAWAAETNYYLVEGAMHLPNGRRIGTSVSIVKRVVDREAGKIEETVLSLRGKEPAQEFVTVIRPEGESAKISSPEGVFSGEATLSGPAWAWTKMTFTTKMAKGGTQVQGEDTFAADSISATKKVIGTDGNVQIEIHESGRSISQAVYDILRTRLLSQ